MRKSSYVCPGHLLWEEKGLIGGRHRDITLLSCLVLQELGSLSLDVIGQGLGIPSGGLCREVSGSDGRSDRWLITLSLPDILRSSDWSDLLCGYHLSDQTPGTTHTALLMPCSLGGVDGPHLGLYLWLIPFGLPAQKASTQSFFSPFPFPSSPVLSHPLSATAPFPLIFRVLTPIRTRHIYLWLVSVHSSLLHL